MGQLVMVWEEMLYNGVSHLVFISEKQNSKEYCKGFEEVRLLFVDSSLNDT